MNIRLNINSQFSRSANRARRGIGDTADNRKRKRTSLERISKRRVMDDARTLRYGVEEINDVFVPARLDIVGSFRPGANLREQSEMPNSTCKKAEEQSSRSRQD